MTKVTLRLLETSEPIVLEAKNTYTKGPLFCLRTKENKTLKFPLCNIFSVEEEGGFSTQN